MGYPRLTEGAVNLIIDYIKANIGAALDSVAAQVGVPHMTIENPKKYFIYPKAQGYEVPAIFIISNDFDFKIAENQANMINATIKIMVSAVVEDQDEEILTYKAWRYQSALHTVLNLADINSLDGKLSLKSVVYHMDGSLNYQDTNAPSSGGVFRKEVILRCQVEHRENF